MYLSQSWEKARFCPKKHDKRTVKIVAPHLRRIYVWKGGKS